MLRVRTLLLVLLLAPACGTSPPPGPAIVVDEPAPRIGCEWMVGDWRGEHGSEHWFRSGDRLYGVGEPPLVLAMQRIPAAAAPELEAADLMFQAATTARGAGVGPTTSIHKAR